MRHAIHARCVLLLLTGALGACAAPPRAGNPVLTEINDVLLKSATDRKLHAVDVTDKSLMPPLAPQAAVDAAVAETRFDLSVVNAPATQVFMALVSGTRYSMLLPPDVSGSLTVNLKDVTVIEALETIRDLYGYEYRIQDKRIFIEPNTVKTRVFHINYLSSRRQGSSDLRVTGSSMTAAGAAAPGTAGGTASSTTGQTAPTGTGTPTAARGSDTSRVSMTSESDFWGDLNRALATIVGTSEGRSVVVNSSSGVVLVRALPHELRNVEKYLKATQLIAERQVMLEAKIIDVTLSEDFQAGVNWGAFASGANSRLGIGVAQPGATIGAGNATQTIGAPSTPTLTVTPGELGSIAASVLGKGFIGLAFRTSNFAALLNFLETQGSVSVLSSPRIATLNNQKAVLKVGTDELFVTNVTSATTTTAAGSVSSPSVTLQPYFSGISLDVTPQIDDDGNIILHVHPAVSTVAEKEKIIDLGSLGIFRLPLAASSINETDSIVRVQDGNIVAIGGLMRQEQASDRSQLPGATGFIANALGQRSSALRKRELVILIKPTLIDNDRVWAQDIKDVQERVRAYPSSQSGQ
ncbi:secretin N-terminal domain-containing protein [Sulfuritalea sp.]|uniref:secretin N-terminal domain-containing protein n=1 Tax=Sulfuritalea sp. TaxID=2480090 RepID=UPI00286E4969|nr:secretin N-terminal domain-containing protein [Sulfuritalea sp.]